MQVHLEVTADDAKNAAKRGDVTIIIDVLRASSTIVTALSNGARQVIPTLTLHEARRISRTIPRCILGGERKGLRPKDFTVGNSPPEYERTLVDGRTVVLTTTSGTRALVKARGSKRILVGSFLNGKAVAEAAHSIAESIGADITLVASGKESALSFEDLLCAGQISEHLNSLGASVVDGCAIAALSWKSAQENLWRSIWYSTHAQYLKSIGFERDVEFCIRVDSSDIVPVLRKKALVPLTDLGRLSQIPSRSR